VTVYAAAPLCAESRRELARNDGRAGEVRLRVTCLDPVRQGDRLDLATIGANARRATEDSTTIAYLSEPGQAVTRYSEPILESANIPQLSGESGAAEMSKLLDAIRSAGSSGSLRESVNDELR
jgi:hypothetical protein